MKNRITFYYLVFLISENEYQKYQIPDINFKTIVVSILL